MRKLMAGYWHQGGLDLYRFEKGRPVKFGGGPLNGLAPVRKSLRKVVLIVGRDRLFHVHKRYPPGPQAKLLQAVHLELGELFPFARPSCHCRMFQASSAYTEVDIWAWDSEPYDQLRKILPFSCVVPEDAMFTSPTPEAYLWTCSGVTVLLAVARNRFLGAVSHPAKTFTEADIRRFLNNLDAQGTEIRKLRIHGWPTAPPHLADLPDLVIEQGRDRPYPPCLDNIPPLNLREFRVRGETLFSLSPEFLFRAAVYLLLGYALFLYLTGNHYERHSLEFQTASRKIDRQILSMESGQEQTDDYTAVRKELNQELTTRSLPLDALNLLAQTLPDGSFLNSVLLSEKTLEISVRTKSPLMVLAALARQKSIRDMRLKGPLNMEMKDGAYVFNVTLEMADI
jgi:Tfp pilus assembly protein PilN